MQKTRKRTDSSVSLPSRPNRRQVVPLPEIVPMDVLGTMLDEDLIVRLRVLTEDINKAIDARLDTRPWETEIAYIRHEQHVRHKRREKHSAFLIAEQRARDCSEACLPHGNFDNHAFIYAATGGRPRWN